MRPDGQMPVLAERQRAGRPDRAMRQEWLRIGCHKRADSRGAVCPGVDDTVHGRLAPQPDRFTVLDLRMLTASPDRFLPRGQSSLCHCGLVRRHEGQELAFAHDIEVPA